MHLFGSFHAFCHHGHVQGFGQVDDQFDDLLAPFPVIQFPEEAHVQLQYVSLDILQHVQGRIAAAEIVQPYQEPPGPQLFNNEIAGIKVFDDG